MVRVGDKFLLGRISEEKTVYSQVLCSCTIVPPPLCCPFPLTFSHAHPLVSHSTCESHLTATLQAGIQGLFGAPWSWALIISQLLCGPILCPPQ